MTDTINFNNLPHSSCYESVSMRVERMVIEKEMDELLEYEMRRDQGIYTTGFLRNENGKKIARLVSKLK